MKMSDVWNQPITYGIYENASVAGNVLPMGFGMLFNNEEPARAIVHAVNNHDRMVEEIAELKSHLGNLVTESIALAQFKNDTLRGNIRSTDLDEPEWHDYQTIGEAGAYLAKLNQEGEE